MNNDQPQNSTVPSETTVPTTAAPAPTAAAPAPESQDISTLSAWPGAFGIYKLSKKAVRVNVNMLGLLIIVGIVWAVLNSITLQNSGLSFVKDLINILMNLALTTAFTLLMLSGVQNEKLSFSQILEKTKKYILNVFVTGFLVGLASLASFLLFIIPYFFVYPRLVFAPYLVINKNMGGVDAFKTSWDMSKGHVGKIYGIAFANIAMGLLAITIIGIPFAIYFIIMYSAAIAILYTYILKQHPIEEAPTSSKVADTSNIQNETPKETSEPVAQTAKVEIPEQPASAPTSAAPSTESTPPTAPTDSTTAPKV